MKKIFGALLIAAGLLTFSSCIMYSPYGGPYSEPNLPYGRSMDISYFYDYLSDYGSWVYWPGYNYVWIPFNAGTGWHPYSNGRWVWTDYGWTWVSYESWGWIPFHYGRWVWEPGFGWFWVPDTVWGPAWVSWQYSDSWIGWAPLPPRYRYAHAQGLVLDSIDLADECWVFVDSRHFTAGRLDRYILARNRNHDIIRTTVFKAQIVERGGRLSNIGLSRDRVEHITRATIPTYELQNASRPDPPRVASGRVIIYRPDVASKPSAKPKKYVTKQDAKRQADRTPPRETGDIKAAASSFETIQPLQVKPREETASSERNRQPVLQQETKKRYGQDAAGVKPPDDKKRPDANGDRTPKDMKTRQAEEKTSLKNSRTSEFKTSKTKRGEDR